MDNRQYTGLYEHDAPNDGLPEHFKPIEEPPIVVGAGVPSAPASAPSGPSAVFAHSLPYVQQLPADIMPTRYAGGIAGYRITPPGANASPGSNSAAQSAVNDD